MSSTETDRSVAPRPARDAPAEDVNRSGPVATRPPQAPPRSAIEENNVDTVLRLFEEGWGAHDGWEDVWRGTMAPGVVSLFHAFPPVEGVEDAIAFNRDLFEGFPELEVTLRRVTAEGGSVVVQGRLRGRHDGMFLKVPASGAMIDVPDVTIFEVEGGRVTEMRYFTDLVTTLTAMGAIPPMT